jgi:hypothetical protein
MSDEHKWHGVITAMAYKYVEVTAPNRKEAERRIKEMCSEHVVGIDVKYQERSRRILWRIKDDE